MRLTPPLFTFLALGTGLFNQAFAITPCSSDFEAWVRMELDSGKQTIILPEGTHHAFAANGSQRKLRLSNNDDGLKNILFDLSGRDGLVIDGNGAEIIFHGHIIPFYMREAKNITIKNLTIDYANPFFSQGTITAVGDGYFEVHFKEQYPIGIDRNRLAFLNPDLPEPMHFNNINIFDAERGRLVFQSWDEYGVGREHTAEMLAADRVRVRSPNIRSPLEVGQVAVFQYNSRSSPGIVVHRGENFVFKDLTIYHTAAFGGLFEGARNIHIEGWEVVSRPGSGRLYSAHHDVTHFVECRGEIRILNNRFELGGDDDVNIHGVFRPVTQRMNPRSIMTRLNHFQQMGVDTLHLGDTIGFHDADTLELLGVGTLAKFVWRDTAQQMVLTFDDVLPDLDWRNIVVTPRLHDTDVVISGNHFSNHRARNLLIKTLGQVRIHDNYFNAQGTGILILTYGETWFESGGVEDVEIFNNVFDQNNSGGFSSATVEIRSRINDSDSEIPIHKNIRIHNNKFIQIFKPLMILERVENIEFYDNEIVRGTDYPLWWKGATEPPNVIVGPGVTKGRFQELD